MPAYNANRPGHKVVKDRWADDCMSKPAYYTTSRFMGRGKYDTREFPTLAEAVIDAHGDRRAMIYVVTTDGMTANLNGTTYLDAVDVTDAQAAVLAA